MKITHVVDVDTTEIRVVLPGQHVDAQTGRRVAVTVDGAGRTSFAIASRPVAHVHHACTTHGQTKGEIEKKETRYVYWDTANNAITRQLFSEIQV